MDLNIARGDDSQVKIKTVEMGDPNFESETSHTAHALVVNPKSVTYDYQAELYLGKTIGHKVASSGVKAFSLPGGQSLSVDFSVNMPALTVPDDTFHVYLEIRHAGAVLITFIGTEDVAVFVTPAIDVETITWD